MPTTNPYIRDWTVDSISRPGKTHKVSQRRDGTFACDCERWKFARAPKPDCHHITSVHEDLRQEKASAQVLTVQAVGLVTERLQEITRVITVTNGTNETYKVSRRRFYRDDD